ncbi:lytic murein transglycosylase [Pseudooceanicola sp. C21-150M6]|uniref:lytic murein transglycosylase n=1 Tax=Pseudooceanicola sp. C21-150M6 TaxID=3434355 RepID=UPI003D7FA84A
MALVSILALLSPEGRAADRLDHSLRPVARPGTAQLSRFVPAAETAAGIAGATLAVLGRNSAEPAARAAIPRPRLRPASAVHVAQDAGAADLDVTPDGFVAWTRAFRGRALAAGVSGRTFDRVFQEVRYLPEVVRLDGRQSEFTKTTGQYLESAVSDTRVAKGSEKAREYDGTLSAIQSAYGVDKRVVAAIWGMETNFGGHRGNTHTPSALATLAFDGRRGAFFEAQLIEVLKILERGDTTSENMKGSWAGAMGHTQFMPTSYQSYAVDFTGDGRRDIWSDNPADALASTAAYLNRMGWVSGMPWGREVLLPSGFDFGSVAGERMPSDWARLGVRGTDGKAVPDFGSARLLLPAGAKGAAFLVFKNFDVIKRYNNSDAYALGVGHLADRIGGAGPLRTAWPQEDRGLKREEREEIQARLTHAGYSTGGVDGRIGPNTVSAIRSYQRSSGLTPDGYPSIALLKHLRR